MGQAGLLLGASFLVTVLGGGIAASGEAPAPTVPSSNTTLADEDGREIAVGVTTTTAATSTTESPAPETTARARAVTEPATPAGAGELVGELVVWFFDVGQGDATLLQWPGFTILIDAGPRPHRRGIPLASCGSHSDRPAGGHPPACRHVRADQDRKLAGFYVDLDGQGNVIHPDDVIGPALVSDAINVYDQVISMWEPIYSGVDLATVFAEGIERGAEELRYALIEGDDETVRRFFGDESLDGEE